ncbi:MAG: YfiR family protein [Magnetococcus sp. DMHC-6]
MTNSLIASEKPTADQLKTAFLYHFIHFIKWPDHAFKNDTKFYLCVFGETHLSSLIQQIAGKTIQQRIIIVRTDLKIDQLEDCHILFFPQTETQSMQKILDSLVGKPILTVGHASGFASSGGMIGFFEEKSKIHFEINLEQAKQSDLFISSKLLQIGKLIGAK